MRDFTHTLPLSYHLEAMNHQYFHFEDKHARTQNILIKVTYPWLKTQSPSKYEVGIGNMSLMKTEFSIQFESFEKKSG